jgi:hypothetical protein
MGPKFGRNRPVATGPHFKLKNYLRASMPSPPPTCDYSPAAIPVLRDIMGNDALGDCVIAGAYHVVGTATGNAGALFHATNAQILADYSAIGGYNPADPSSDQGCDEVVALNYWTQHGFANGTKLAGWLTVNPLDHSEIASACWLFENLYFGIELPDAWVGPFPSSDGFSWGPGTPDPNNGHCVIGTGYNADGASIDTWGLLGTVTWDAISSLCTTAAGGALYVMLTPDMLAKGAAKAPNGFAWADLIADFDAMGGSVPVPPAPPPSPSPPGSTVTLAQAQAWANAGLASGHALMTRGTAETLVASALAAGWPK